MSQQPQPQQRSPSSSRVRLQLRSLRRTQRGGTFGIAEILGLVLSALILLMVLGSYLYFLAPAGSRLTALQRERAGFQTKLRADQAIMKQDQDTRTIVEKITGSLEEFETRGLAEHTQGRMDLYDELNQLIRKNGLRNTSGPTYTGLAPAGSKTSATRSTSTKWQSVYPGIAIGLTVEGQYQSIRHFVRDIEAGRQFIIINAVELERATETNVTPADSGAPGSRGSLVSLRLDMATYFKRYPADGSFASESQ